VSVQLRPLLCSELLHYFDSSLIKVSWYVVSILAVLYTYCHYKLWCNEQPHTCTYKIKALVNCYLHLDFLYIALNVISFCEIGSTISIIEMLFSYTH